METLIDHTKFALRLQKIMDDHQLTAASFAEKLEVGRATISHVMSGRNKPSLDFVMKVVSVFNRVDLNWLIYGIHTPQNSLSSTSKSSATFHEGEPQKSNKKDALKSATKAVENNAHSLSKMNTTSSPVKRVILFKEDGTFESYEM